MHEPTLPVMPVTLAVVTRPVEPATVSATSAVPVIASGPVLQARTAASTPRMAASVSSRDGESGRSLGRSDADDVAAAGVAAAVGAAGLAAGLAVSAPFNRSSI